MQESDKTNKQTPPSPTEGPTSFEHFQDNALYQTEQLQEEHTRGKYQLEPTNNSHQPEPSLPPQPQIKTEKTPLLGDSHNPPSQGQEEIGPKLEGVRQKSQSIQHTPKRDKPKEEINSLHKSSDDNFEIYMRVVEGDIDELPLHSIVSIAQRPQPFDFCSSGSDTSEPKTGKSKHCEHDALSGQSFQSEESPQLDTSMNKCLRCQSLRKSNQKYFAFNNSYAAELNLLRRENTVLRQSKGQVDVSTQIPEEEEAFSSIQSCSQDRRLVVSLRRIQEVLQAIKEPGFQQILKFTTDEEKMIVKVIKDLKYLLRIIEKEQLIVMEEKIEKMLHNKYTTIINEIKKNYNARILRMDQNFKGFMTALKEKKDQDDKNTEKEGSEKRRVQKKMNSLYVSTEDFYIKNSEMEHLKEKVSLLEMNLKEEKKKNSNLQTINKALIQKYSKEISELCKQKNLLIKTVKRYEGDFEIFMEKITSNSTLTNQISHAFFRNVSLRVFEISNCIPFEENDEQNLFAPDNETELMDMIERIRRFSLTIEDFTSKKDSYEVNMKKSVTSLFKELVEGEKVSLKFALKLIKNNSELELDYLREFLMHLLEKRSKKDAQKGEYSEWSEKKKKMKKSVSLEKIQGFALRFDSPSKN